VSKDYRETFLREAEAYKEEVYREGRRTRGGDQPIRAQILDEAKTAVCQDRNADYGEPIDNFTRWAGACNALGYRGPGGRELKPHDLAMIMGLGKLSRLMQTPAKQDGWVDLAGYAAVGYECVTLEDQ